MKTYYECVPCFIKQVLRFLPQLDASLHQEILSAVLKKLSTIDFASSPPQIASSVFDIVKEHIGDKDLYLAEKLNSNHYMLGLEAELRQIIANGEHPFITGLQLAIAGNIIDFGAKHDFSDEVIHNEIAEVLNEQLPIDEVEALSNAIEKADKILYLGDNAGEIVFDKLFIEQLPMNKITFVVRGAPVINDALLADAKMVGMNNIVPVVDNGSAMPGTVLSDCSEAFNKLFNNADLIIAKGQGNYETLSQHRSNIFFLLKVKCEIVAHDLNRHVGDFVIKKCHAR